MAILPLLKPYKKMKNLMKGLAVLIISLIIVSSAVAVHVLEGVDINSALLFGSIFVIVALVFGRDSVMGIVTQNPLIGRARKSAGSNTFTTWKGLNVVKTKPLQVANPDTDGQQMNRNAMRYAVEIFRFIAAAVNYGFIELAIHMSAYNAFISYMRRNSFDYSTPPDATIVYADIEVARGSIYPTLMNTVVIDNSALELQVTFSNTVDAPGQSLSDRLYAVIFNETAKSWETIVNPAALRSTGSYNWALNESYAVGDNCHVYTFFSKADGRKASDSRYNNVIVVA